jgi:AcrR family transcriptional regulator
VKTAPGVERTTGAVAVAKILERAIEVIAEGGETAIRTNPIAYECGTTPPVLYRAFGSREGLVIAAQAERYRRSIADIIEFLAVRFEAAASRDDMKRSLDEALNAAFASARSHARQVRTEVLGAAVCRPELQAAVVAVDREMISRLEGALAHGVAAGWLVGGPRLRAVIMWSLAATNGRLSVEFDQEADYSREWKDVAREGIFNALFPD